MPENLNIKLLIIDDQKLIIDGLMSLLDQTKDMEVVGYTTDGQQAANLIESNTPDVVLMDYRFPALKKDGIDLATEILAINKNIKFLMLTSYDEFALVKEALKRGIKGFLLKNVGREELTHAIRQVAAGHNYLGTHIQEQIIANWGENNTHSYSHKARENHSKKNHPLTKRELEIAQLYSKGKARKEIAEALFISTNTVDTHLKNTFGKLEVKNVAELINFLMKKGLFEL